MPKIHLSREFVATIIFLLYVGVYLGFSSANSHPDLANEHYRFVSMIVGAFLATSLWVIGWWSDGNSQRGFPSALFCLALSHLLGWPFGLLIWGFLIARIVGTSERPPSTRGKPHLVATLALSAVRVIYFISAIFFAVVLVVFIWITKDGGESALGGTFLVLVMLCTLPVGLICHLIVRASRRRTTDEEDLYRIRLDAQSVEQIRHNKSTKKD